MIVLDVVEGKFTFSSPETLLTVVLAARRYRGRSSSVDEEHPIPTPYEIQIDGGSDSMAVSTLAALSSTLLIVTHPSSISSGAVRNLESARVSVPSLLIPQPNRAEGSQDVVWRTDLVATAPYWEGMDGFSTLPFPHRKLTLRFSLRVVPTPLVEFPGGKSSKASSSSRTGAPGPRADGGTDVSRCLITSRASC